MKPEEVAQLDPYRRRSESLTGIPVELVEEVPNPDANYQGTRFTDKDRLALEKMGYRIYKLEGKSIQELQEEEDIIVIIPGDDYREIFSEKSGPTEVAVDIESILLGKVGYELQNTNPDFKTLDELDVELSEDLDSFDTIIGSPSEYIQVLRKHRETTGNRVNFPWGIVTVFDNENLLMQINLEEKPMGKVDIYNGINKALLAYVIPLVVPKAT